MYSLVTIAFSQKIKWSLINLRWFTVIIANFIFCLSTWLPSFLYVYVIATHFISCMSTWLPFTLFLARLHDRLFIYRMIDRLWSFVRLIPIVYRESIIQERDDLTDNIRLTCSSINSYHFSFELWNDYHNYRSNPSRNPFK